MAQPARTTVDIEPAAAQPAAVAPWWHALAHLGDPLKRHALRLKLQGLAFLVLILSAAFYFESTPINGIILCPLRRFTGIECAGCGMSRSWCAIADGELSLSVALNPFGPLLMALAVAKVITLAVEVSRRRRLVMPAWQRIDTPVLALVAVSMMVFGVYRALHTVMG